MKAPPMIRNTNTTITSTKTNRVLNNMKFLNAIVLITWHLNHLIFMPFEFGVEITFCQTSLGNISNNEFQKYIFLPNEVII